MRGDTYTSPIAANAFDTERTVADATVEPFAEVDFHTPCRKRDKSTGNGLQTVD
jgi:hypothetical protein